MEIDNLLSNSQQQLTLASLPEDTLLKIIHFLLREDTDRHRNSHVTYQSLVDFSAIAPFLSTCKAIQDTYYSSIHVIDIAKTSALEKASPQLKYLIQMLRFCKHVREIRLPPLPVDIMAKMMRCNPVVSLTCLKRLELQNPTDAALHALLRAPPSLTDVKLWEIGYQMIRDVVMVLQAWRSEEVTLRRLEIMLDKGYVRKGTGVVPSDQERKTIRSEAFADNFGSGQKVVFYVTKMKTTVGKEGQHHGTQGDGEDDAVRKWRRGKHVDQIIRHIAIYMLVHDLIRTMTIKDGARKGEEGDAGVENEVDWGQWTSLICDSVDDELLVTAMIELRSKKTEDVERLCEQIRLPLVHALDMDGSGKYRVMIGSTRRFCEVMVPESKMKMKYIGCDVVDLLTPTFLYADGDTSGLVGIEVGDVRRTFGTADASDMERFEEIMQEGNNITHLKLNDPCYVVRRGERQQIYEFHLGVALRVLQCLGGLRVVEVHTALLEGLIDNGRRNGGADGDMGRLLQSLANIEQLHIFHALSKHTFDVDRYNGDDWVGCVYDTTPVLKALPLLWGFLPKFCTKLKVVTMAEGERFATVIRMGTSCNYSSGRKRACVERRLLREAIDATRVFAARVDLQSVTGLLESWRRATDRWWIDDGPTKAQPVLLA